MKWFFVLLCGCANLLGIDDVHPGGPKPDGGGGPDGGSGGDAGSGGFMCNDDTQLEPNDTLPMAVVTPLDQPVRDQALGVLAICPATDKDTYEVQISMNLENFEAVATTTGGALAHVSILNAGGSPIANGNATGPMQQTATAANLPPGMYYAQVTAGGESNYNLDLHVTGP